MKEKAVELKYIHYNYVSTLLSNPWIKDITKLGKILN